MTKREDKVPEVDHPGQAVPKAAGELSGATTRLGPPLAALIDIARETSEELSREELDLDRLAELRERREKAFASLQEAYEGVPAEVQTLLQAQKNEGGERAQELDFVSGGETEAGAELRALRKLVEELSQLHRATMERMNQRLSELKEEVGRLQLQRRSLTAYGWVDPVHAPKGAFIDRVQG